MILSDIKRYLQERQQATLSDIALHFDAEPDAVRGMLEHWVRKGKVERRLLHDACGSGCNKCDLSGTEIYLWQDGLNGPNLKGIPIKQDCPSS